MKLKIRLTSGVAAVLLAACGDSTGPDGSAQSARTESFEWSGSIAAAGTVEIKNISGEVRASPSRDGTIRLRARIEGTLDDPSTVRIEVVETEQGVTICTVYPDVPGQGSNQCLPGLAGRLSSRNNDVVVTIDVEVPADCPFIGRTLSGAVKAADLASDVTARTTAGDIDVSTSGVAVASTLSGNITASIGRSSWDRNLTFGSLYGDVTVRVPANVNADVWGSTGSGSVATDFPLTITRLGTSRQLHGVLGNGGRNLRLTTINGDIALRSN